MKGCCQPDPVKFRPKGLHKTAGHGPLELVRSFRCGVQYIQDDRLEPLHICIAQWHLLSRLLAEFRECSRANAQRDARLVSRHEHSAAAKRFELEQLAIVEYQFIQVRRLKG